MKSTEKLPAPKCPAGHDMILIALAGGSYRYGCLECATHGKTFGQSVTGGWLAPKRASREGAYKAAMKRPGDIDGEEADEE